MTLSKTQREVLEALDKPGGWIYFNLDWREQNKEFCDVRPFHRNSLYVGSFLVLGLLSRGWISRDSVMTFALQITSLGIEALGKVEE